MVPARGGNEARDAEAADASPELLSPHSSWDSSHFRLRAVIDLSGFCTIAYWIVISTPCALYALLAACVVGCVVIMRAGAPHNVFKIGISVRHADTVAVRPASLFRSSMHNDLHSQRV